MTLDTNIRTTSIYTYAYADDEESLCLLEQCVLFGNCTGEKILESSIQIDPSRSPFMIGRLDVMLGGHSLLDIIEQISSLPREESTFKVIVDKKSVGSDGVKLPFEERKLIERKVGQSIYGKADLVHGERVYGILVRGESWYFGRYYRNESIWYKHMHKPHDYSTALSTRVARAVVNIAVPRPDGIRVIDPCCGIGTVLVEALSMGIDIVGRDVNPLVIRRARDNITHFGLTGKVTLGAIEHVEGDYHVAIVDLPYNLCSVISPEEQLSMLQSAAKCARKVVIITIEPIDQIIERAELTVIDRCVAKKGTFSREVIVTVSSNDESSCIMFGSV